MKLNLIKQKPRLIEAPTKQELLKKILHSGSLTYHLTYSGTKTSPFKAYLNTKTDTVLVFNLHKVRRKVQRGVKFKTIDGVKRKIKTSTVVRPNHWIAYVYTFPKSLLQSVNQESRNFELTIKI